MALSPILHSIYGKRLGLNPDGVLIQPEVTSRTVAASTATTIPYYGHTTITSSSSATYTLAAPLAAGVYKTIAKLSTTTASTETVAVASGNIQSSIGSSGTRVLLSGVSMVTLVGLTTALYAVVAGIGGGGGTYSVTT